MEVKAEELLKEDIAEAKEEISKVEFPEIGKGRYVEGLGRRKRAVARVRIWDQEGSQEFNIVVNNKNYLDYFRNIELLKIVEAPLKKIKAQKVYRVTCQVKGGGIRGQAEAIRLGLSRALVMLNEEWKPIFKQAGFLTRDPREVERKKYGKRKARKEEQWQKR